MQIDNITEIFYSRDIQKIKEVLTPIINDCKINNKTNILLEDFRIDLEDLIITYTNIDGYVECTKNGTFKKTDNIIDAQSFAITSEKKDTYEKDIPLLQTISSIETIANEIYETHHVEVINSNILATQIISKLENVDVDNESKALLSKRLQPTDKINYVESYLNNEYLQPVVFNEITNKYELVDLIRQEEICENYVLSFIEEEIIVSLIYKIIIEILLNR